MNSHSQTTKVSQLSPPLSLQVPRFFKTNEDIKAYFDKNGIPVEVKEIQAKKEKYYFVLAYPYSGIDTTDLYCFVKGDAGWGMFLKAFLWKTPFKEDVKFKLDGDFVDVLCKSIVVLKINPPH